MDVPLGVDVVDGFFGKTMILAIVSFVLLSGISFSALTFFGWCGVVFQRRV